MKSMKISSLTGILFVFFGLTPAVADDYPNEQSYVILINNENAGIETVIEDKDNSGAFVFTSEHELFVNDGTTRSRLIFSTKMVFSRGTRTLQTYACRYKTGQGGDSYDVSVKNGQITRVLTRNGQSVEVTAPFTSNMVIVDFNVYYQYEQLIRRYDLKKKGPQVFANFIPVIGNDIPLKVTWLDDETLRFGEKTIETSRFRIESADIQTTTLFVDKNNRLAVLENPAQELKVIRKDLLFGAEND